ncbi:MAG: zinc ribbon domain-containing protein [Alteromonadaceae bacterium]|nr:zinc ribbon domain-containing protein [Alteromonadaceae bacterium]
MALIDCPSCGKKMSDKAKSCPNCDFSYADATPEDVERKLNMKRFKKMHSIQNQSMLAMLLFIGGFGFMYWGGVSPGDMQHNLALLSCVVGFAWYGINRVRIVLLKRSTK